MQLTFRPIPVWPYQPTAKRRGPYTFSAGWTSTLELLERELRLLGGHDPIIGGDFREEDIRLDGMIRSNARAPLHPGIELSFESKHGRLVYATDVCTFWQHNVRSIALGLESLRAVDRFGISAKGQQYAGWLQLTTSEPSVERGRRLVEEAGGLKKALLVNHPDQGGDPRALADVLAFRTAFGEQPS